MSGVRENPGLAKLGVIPGAVGFPPALRFGAVDEARATDDAPLASSEDGNLRSITEEARKPRPKNGRLPLGVARQTSPPPEGG